MTTPPPTQPYKAIAGFLIAFVGALVTAITQENVDELGWQGWVAIVATALITAGGVYQVTNPPVSSPAVGPPETPTGP
jgi:drug/metabolite transporter (DMT)-like permease